MVRKRTPGVTERLALIRIKGFLQDEYGWDGWGKEHPVDAFIRLGEDYKGLSRQTNIGKAFVKQVAGMVEDRRK